MKNENHSQINNKTGLSNNQSQTLPIETHLKDSHHKQINEKISSTHVKENVKHAAQNDDSKKEVPTAIEKNVPKTNLKKEPKEENKNLIESKPKISKGKLIHKKNL